MKERNAKNKGYLLILASTSMASTFLLMVEDGENFLLPSFYFDRDNKGFDEAHKLLEKYTGITKDWIILGYSGKYNTFVGIVPEVFPLPESSYKIKWKKLDFNSCDDKFKYYDILEGALSPDEFLS